jgi:hypothetical protein
MFGGICAHRQPVPEKFTGTDLLQLVKGIAGLLQSIKTLLIGGKSRKLCLHSLQHAGQFRDSLPVLPDPSFQGPQFL